MSEPQRATGSEVDAVARRLEGIVTAAERAAREVIDEAEEAARRRIERADARAERLVAERLTALAELSETLRAQAEAIGRQGERLMAALEAAGGGAAGADGAPPAPQPPRATTARRGHLSAVEPPESGGEPAGARLLATQMAVSGSSREEIDRRLRNGFGIEDTDPILDAILGPED